MSRAVETAYEDAQKSTFTFLDNGTIEVRNASLLWRDFAGKPTKFSKQGKKPNFNLVLNDEMLAVLEQLSVMKGANFTIHHTNLYSDEFCQKNQCENIDVAYINIKVDMNSAYPPVVKLFSEYKGEKSCQVLDKDTIVLLDSADIIQADLVFRAYINENFPDTCTAYLKKLYVIQNPQVDFDGAYDDWDRPKATVECNIPVDGDFNPATGD